MSGPERKVPGEPVRMDAEDPHIGAHHRGSKHPLAIPEGVSTIAHSSIRKRAKRQQRPRYETLVIGCCTGGCAWLDASSDKGFLQANQYNCIPVMPWHEESFFWDWTSAATPNRWNPVNLGANTVDRPTLAQFTLNYPMIPKHEQYEDSTNPEWFTTAFLESTRTSAGRNAIAYSQWENHVNSAKRLSVNGAYYEETLVFQGKIVIPRDMGRFANAEYGAQLHATINHGRPWIRLIAIQLVDEDMSGTLLHSFFLDNFFPHTSSDTIIRGEDPDYARRRTEDEKTNTAHHQKYRILIDHTWDIMRPDNTPLREIPLKLKLAPGVIRKYDGVLDADPAPATYAYPREYGPSKDGRVIWQLFHNIAFTPQPEGPANLAKLDPAFLPMWYGTWTTQIKDGNY